MATQTNRPGHTGGISQTWPSAKGTQRPERPDPWGNYATTNTNRGQERTGGKAVRPAPVDDRGSS